MSKKLVEKGNHPIKGLNECNDASPIQESRNTDKPSPECPEPIQIPSQADVVERPDLSWVEESARKKTNIGGSGICDPVQTGQIVEDVKQPNRDVLYRYTKALRGANEAMMNLFSGIVVLDESGEAHPVPIIWATQERAVTWILQDNTRKDNSLVVDRIRLPVLALHSTNIQFDQTRYIYHKAVDYMRRLRPDHKPGFTVQEQFERDTVFGVARGIPVNITFNLLSWAMYVEDMDQMIEQIMLKFSPVAYIRIRGVQWETIVTLDGVNNNTETEPGDQKRRIVRTDYNMTVQTYIPQPIVRKKAVLKTKTDIYDSIEEEDITLVLSRLEEKVKELND